MTEPKPWDFGVTRDQYALYRGTQDNSVWVWLFALVAALLGGLFGGIFFGSQVFLSIGLASGISGLIVSGLFNEAIREFRRFRLLRSPVGSQIKLYEEARMAYPEAKRRAELSRKAQWEAERPQREAEWARQEVERARRQKHVDYWMSLSGRAFELEMAALCRRLGYRVETTPTSGDEGVDIVLWKRKQKIVVQCKSHKSPVGPAVVRELYGSMIAAKAHKAVLACTGGFTRGVKEFVEGKPIELVSASGLVELADGLSEPVTDKQHPLD